MSFNVNAYRSSFNCWRQQFILFPMATQNGARALGWPDSGAIVPGNLADLILLEYSTGKRMADEVIMARRETLELSMTLEMAIAERNTALARLQSLYPTLEP
jgi:cytosine/adenosine deaminase-related metal-dependent hydrolase